MNFSMNLVIAARVLEGRILLLGVMGGGAWLGIESSSGSGSGSGSGGVWALKRPRGPNVELGGPLRAPRAQM